MFPIAVSGALVPGPYCGCASAGGAIETIAHISDHATRHRFLIVFPPSIWTCRVCARASVREYRHDLPRPDLPAARFLAKTVLDVVDHQRLRWLVGIVRSVQRQNPGRLDGRVGRYR